jgi:hypothetical protein
LPCFVLCMHWFPFFHSYRLCNWPLGCWVSTQINKNWIEFNWINFLPTSYPPPTPYFCCSTRPSATAQSNQQNLSQTMTIYASTYTLLRLRIVETANYVSSKLNGPTLHVVSNNLFIWTYHFYRWVMQNVCFAWILVVMLKHFKPPIMLCLDQPQNVPATLLTITRLITS